MKATVMYEAGDVRVEEVADAGLVDPTDALVRVTHSCICGSDLWPYRSMPAVDGGRRMGHEFVGVVEDVGAEVTTVASGDLVIAPFVWSDGSCDFCREGLHTSCRHGGFWGNADNGAQAEAVRVPWADGTLVRVATEPDDALLPSLLTLSDVFATGHHAAVSAGVGPGATVAVIGDGAVGLCGVLAAKRLGAERVIILGRHEDRTEIARQFGATDVVAVRGKEAVHRVRELTGGDGAPSVLECVGTTQSFDTAVSIARSGGAVGRVGVPQDGKLGQADAMFMRNISVRGGVCPARAYIPELLPDVLEGRVEPGRVFDRTIGLDEVPEGYRAMNDRETIKALVEP
ncbi:MAG: zinc-dependent alcohol dehydrogenase family protein [Actinomycetota bacterium]|nr:zinc-dependent alcohol dehydrogenase family protein [Actinomycetota bacterium]